MYRLFRPFYPIVYRIIKWYHRKPRRISKRGIRMRLLPSVFHPTYYLSTDILLDYALELDLSERSVLELGCGSGFISLYLAKHTTAEINSSDVNVTAIEGLKYNVTLNDVKITCYESDVFDSIPEKKFDIILLNPPYFEKDPRSTDEFAFLAGSDLQYFKKLFSQIGDRFSEIGFALMILSENVNLDKVLRIAQENDLLYELVYKKRSKQELFFIYRFRG